MDRRAVLVAASVAVLVLLCGYASIAASSPIRRLTDTTSINVRPAWSADGKRIAFQTNRDGPYHIYVMDADGSNVQRLTDGDADDRHPAWSPDGRYIAVDSGGASVREIWIIDVASHARTQVTKLGQVASFPSFSSDGKHLAFYLYASGTMDLWSVGADASAPTQLTHGLASERNNQCTFACHSAGWSPDGRSIAFANGDQTQVLVMPVGTIDAATPISPSGESSHFPVFLADGRIAYVTEHIDLPDSYTDLWTVGQQVGAQRTQLVQGVLAQGPFELSGDGKELLFASPRSGNFEIYAVTLDAAGKAALASKPQTITSTGAAASAAPSGLDLTKGPAPYVAGGAAIAAFAVTLAIRARRRRPRA